MDNCKWCKYAELDCYEFYGTTQTETFVCGCEKDNDVCADECEDYEEYIPEDTRK